MIRLDLLPRAGSFASAVIAALAMVACAGSEQAPKLQSSPASVAEVGNFSEQVRVDGSSTVYLISEAMADEFQRKNANVQLTVNLSGTGGGFERFCNGETDVSGASRPIKASEVEACKAKGIEYIELPIAYDGLAMVVNPKNNWATCITVDDLKKAWEPKAQGKINRWNQVRSAWPDAPLVLFGAGKDSGTYDYFTEAIVGKEDASREDFTASEDDNDLVQGVANDPNAMGFFGVAYYQQNQDKLKLVAVDSGNGCVVPNPETVTNGTYQPLARPLFIYVNKMAAKRPNVNAFVQFYLDAQNAQTLVSEVGYIPLPDKFYKLAQQRYLQGVTGSVFGGQGSQVGIALNDLLNKEK